MVVLNEARHLETLKCYYNSSLDVFVFHCAGKKITIQYASPEQVAAVFRKAQVKDEHTEPRSLRGKTYLEMVAAVIDGSDQTNYLWSTEVDNFFNACEELRQSRIGKVSMPVNESRYTVADFEKLALKDPELKATVKRYAKSMYGLDGAIKNLMDIAKREHPHDPAGKITYAQAKKIVNQILNES